MADLSAAIWFSPSPLLFDDDDELELEECEEDGWGLRAMVPRGFMIGPEESMTSSWSSSSSSLSGPCSLTSKATGFQPRGGGTTDTGAAEMGAWPSSVASSESPLDRRGEAENNVSMKRARFRPRPDFALLFRFFFFSRHEVARLLPLPLGDFAPGKWHLPLFLSSTFLCFTPAIHGGAFTPKAWKTRFVRVLPSFCLMGLYSPAVSGPRMSSAHRSIEPGLITA